MDERQTGMAIVADRFRELLAPCPFPPLRGAPRTVFRGRSKGAEHAPRNPFLAPQPLSRPRERGASSIAAR